MSRSLAKIRRVAVAPVWADVVPLPENRSALFAAQRAVARVLKAGNRKTTSPIVFHGGAGTGKSLLVQSMVSAITHDGQGLTARILSARELPKRKADDDEVREEFGELVQLDFLGIEDLQHLPLKLVQDFCLLLDKRTARRKLTVVTANAGPAHLDRYPRRLTSRLSAGLVVQLEPIGRTSRRELLMALLFRKALRLTGEAVDVLLERTKGGGVRPLLGIVETLKTLTRHTSTANPPLTAETVIALLESSEFPTGQGPMPELLKRVAKHYGISRQELLGSSRRRDVLVPRQVLMYLAREMTRLSFPQIGEACGGRDHTTVMHAWRKISEDAKTDPALAMTLRDLRGELG
ncbi:MAG: helix-turn-helix domain-containing protein [Fimbriiglobus sp.]